MRARTLLLLPALGWLCVAPLGCERPCREYVAVGDSITAGNGDSLTQDGVGYVDALQLLLPAASFHNEGIGKSTLDQWVNEGLLERALDRHPGACGVLVILGTNDMWKAARKMYEGEDAEADFERIAANFQRLERMLRARKLRAWVATFPTPHGGGPFARANGIIREAVGRSGYFRPGPDLARLFEGLDAYFIPDKVHPNGLGYVAMAMAWREALDADRALRDAE